MLEGDRQHKKADYEKEMMHNKELQAEITSYKNKVRVAQQNVTSLEARVRQEAVLRDPKSFSFPL